MTSLNNYTFGHDPPELYEVLQATRDAGLVGEESTVLTLVLAMIRGHLVVMTGLARAGKDICVDAAESVFPTDEIVYKWPVDDSETAAYYNRDEINQYPVHRFPDLARLPEHQEKILKAFGEGRDAVRNRTDITAEKRGDDPIEDQVITAPNTVIAFIATDNENVNLDDFPEIRNRALIISVDATERQTKKVNRRKALEHAGMTERLVDPFRRAQIQDYHASIPVDEWINRSGASIVNPASVSIHEQEPIPELYPEARQDFDRLLGFMETVALYHYIDRLVVDDPSKMMLVAPTDIWEAMTILGNKMVMSALNLQREDRAILRLLEDARHNLTKADIQQQLRAQGFNITDRDVKRSLDSMRTKGYVRLHQGNPNQFSLNDFASVTDHDAGLDYDAIVDAARSNVYEIIPAERADAYVDEFCKGDGLITTHPFTGEAVNITEADPLDSAMDDGIDDIEAIFDEAREKYDVDDEDSDGDGGDSKLQGTLT